MSKVAVTVRDLAQHRHHFSRETDLLETDDRKKKDEQSASCRTARKHDFKITWRMCLFPGRTGGKLSIPMYGGGPLSGGSRSLRK
jgi:hypothetical protein